MPPASKRFSFERYDFESFDKNLCLKPPLLLWLAMLYLARALLLPFVGGISSMGGSSVTSTLTRGLFGVEDYIPAAVTSLMLLAFLRRTPTASRLWRHIWNGGQFVLGSAATVDLTVAVLRLRQVVDNASWQTSLLLGACLMDCYIVLYLLTSRRVRDVFCDFPAPLRDGQPE